MWRLEKNTPCPGNRGEPDMPAPWGKKAHSDYRESRKSRDVRLLGASGV